MFKKLFAPGNDSVATSIALLLLRLCLGLTMLLHHGATKVRTFSDMAPNFPDPLGVGHHGSLALAAFAEVVGSLLLITGLVTRFGALVAAINMGVAFAIVHAASFSGKQSGELAFVYLAGFVTLLFAGG